MGCLCWDLCHGGDAHSRWDKQGYHELHTLTRSQQGSYTLPPLSQSHSQCCKSITNLASTSQLQNRIRWAMAHWDQTNPQEERDKADKLKSAHVLTRLCLPWRRWPTAFSELYPQIVPHALGRCLPRACRLCWAACQPCACPSGGLRRASLRAGLQLPAAAAGLATVSCWAAEACPPPPGPAALA